MHSSRSRIPAAALAALAALGALMLTGCVPAAEVQPEGDPRVVGTEWTETTTGSAASTAQCELVQGSDGLLPDEECTPGAVTSEISAANTAPVCGAPSGPDVSATVRTSVLNAYGVAELDHDKYVIDFLVPRQLGGANDFANLWPIPLNDPAMTTKRATEAAAIDAVCGGRAGIQAAQYALASDWTSALALLRIG